MTDFPTADELHVKDFDGSTTAPPPPATKFHSELHAALGVAINALEAKEIPAGGTTGQVLAKDTNTDYDTEWVDQSGASTADDRASYSGSPVSAPIGIGNNTELIWDTLGAGATLLDLSEPTRPTVLAGGIYSVTAIVQDFTEITAGGGMLVELHLDFLDQDAVCEMTYGIRADSVIITSINNTYFIPTGGVIVVVVRNHDGVVAHDVNLREALIQLIQLAP